VPSAAGAGRQVFGMPAQHRVNARDEFARVERLRQVIVRAHLQSDDAVDILTLRRQHDHRHRFSGPSQPPADREPVLARQHQVEHQQMRRIALQLLVELPCVGERLHLESVLGQVADEELAQARVVVDHQDLWNGLFHRAQS
jgi:hypothetical protein